MKKIIAQPVSRGLISLIIAILSSLTFSVAAAQTEAYTDWKAREQQYDGQLKQQSAQNSSAQASHYLAKPALVGTAQADKIRLNSASIEQLQQLHGVGLKKAQAILEYRNTHGQFKRIEDIQLVKGIGPALFAKNQAKLAL